MVPQLCLSCKLGLLATRMPEQITQALHQVAQAARLSSHHCDRGE
jgi:hypothetical protein